MAGGPSSPLGGKFLRADVVLLACTVQLAEHLLLDNVVRFYRPADLEKISEARRWWRSDRSSIHVSAQKYMLVPCGRIRIRENIFRHAKIF